MTSTLPTQLPGPTPEHFTSRLRSPAVAARVGLWLGLSFGVCFLTGLLSHYAQNTSQPIPFPTSPSWGYRVTQGLHVITGTAAVPLLLVKLWTVYPRLFERPPSLRVRQLLVTGLERVSILALVASSIFMLVSGLTNTASWYVWHFGFRAAHYGVAWVAIGSLLVHIAVKLPVIREALLGDVDDTHSHDRATAVDQGVMSRRALLRTTWLASGTAVVLTAGATVPWLRTVSVFGIRSGDGPQGIPVNRTARAAGLGDDELGDSWRLTVTNGDQSVSLSRADLAGMTQRTETLPIACVEGWSANGDWTGVRMSDVLALVGADPESDVTVSSIQQNGPYYTVNTLQKNFTGDDRTLLALRLNGKELDPDHGYPCRLIAPNRPGVLQTKWLGSIEVQA
ncbi:molybdopterin-dependent oxidoreductase [Nocardioides rubriscoriae]|uniref:molybdopterin-dependent oxidoreductase n=1 Tax=Nocardioides rubriscoriae TaxID=642762 RepID=UPI0011DF28CF|nr:molybdopterin-dependent oxidoreductase [Nocardioides rubriscoriae]